MASLEQELTQHLGRPIPVTSPDVSYTWRLRGFEVALTSSPIPPASVRRVWREREAGRGVPLLLVMATPSGDDVAVAGPREPAGAAPQVVRLADFLRLLDEGKAAANPNAATRQLSDALDHLKRSPVPGVVVHGLLTDHYLQRRLQQRPERAQLAEAAQPGIRPMGWQARLTALGYEVRQAPHGYLAVHHGRTLALVHPYADPGAFSRMDDSGRLPEGHLIAECEQQGAPWGILAAGDRLRLFQTRPDRGAATDRWLEVDAANLELERTHVLGLFAPPALQDGGILSQLLDDARNFGAELKDRLDRQIRLFALPHIAQGLGDWLVAAEGRDLADPPTRREIQQATYTLLFRLLFILYAESAGYLPYDRSDNYRHRSLRTLCNEARQSLDRADPRSAGLWRDLTSLCAALRTGSTTFDVHAYNGSLFHENELPGAALLERASITDAHLAPALDAIGFDYEGGDEAGLDYSGLEIGHLGAVYEGLLALRLSVADQSYRWDEKRDRFIPDPEPGDSGVAAGQLFLQTEAGGRKSAGVFYTRQEIVRHLVSNSVLPALEEHLAQVRARAAQDPAAAARLLFRFRVLDPAMGSAHFLVDALDVIADRVQTFLAETPLPAVRTLLDELRAEAGASHETVEDGRLLRRLLLKHCIYGVDLQEMAVELARVALWLASFVPGLALSYLDHNLQQGDALVGLANFELLAPPTADGRARAGSMWTDPNGPLGQALRRASELAQELSDMQDRTPAEVAESRRKSAELEQMVAGARRAFNLWTAEPFGVKGARDALLDAQAILSGQMAGGLADLARSSAAEASTRHFFHWPLAFPEAFHSSSERQPGFDAVVGNPPWDEITVEELGFYALHDPGLRGLGSGPEQRHRIAALLARFPELQTEFEARRREVEVQRGFFRPENGYAIQGAGDLDLYELFCERYQSLARTGGWIAVVQPRSTFLAKGSRGFRRWLFGNCTVQRIDFLVNSRRWAFDMEPRYTVALVAVRVSAPPKGALLHLTGPAPSLTAFHQSIGGSPVMVALDDLARWTPCPSGDLSDKPTWEVPLLPTQDYALVFAKFRHGPSFATWQASHNGVFAATELHETQQRGFFSHATGIAVWKGESFDQYDPHGRGPAGYARWDDVSAFVQGKRTSRHSSFKGKFPEPVLRDPMTHPHPPSPPRLPRRIPRHRLSDRPGLSRAAQHPTH